MGQTLENGYKVKTTFWADFTIADKFGASAVKDTFKRSFRDWKKNYEYITELAIVTNWKCWEHYHRHNMELSQIYSDMYYKVRNWCINHLKGDELKYYLQWTD